MKIANLTLQDRFWVTLGEAGSLPELQPSIVLRKQQTAMSVPRQAGSVPILYPDKILITQALQNRRNLLAFALIIGIC